MVTSLPTIPKQRIVSGKPFLPPPIFWPNIENWDDASARPPPRHAQIRWFVVPKSRNYLIFYQPYRETIMVIRVLHPAQDWTRFFPAK